MKKVLCVLLLPVLLAAAMTLVLPTVAVRSILPVGGEVRLGVGQTTRAAFAVTALAGGAQVTAEYTADGRMQAPAEEGPLTRHVLNTLQKMSAVWASDQPDIAAVAADGGITGVAPGRAVVTLALRDAENLVSGAVWVWVVQPVAQLRLPDALSLGVGQQHALAPEILPEDAEAQSLVYTSSRPDIAAVDDGGVVRALASGEAEITLTAPNDGIGAPVTATVRVTVAAPPEGIELNATQLSLVAGKSAQLEATVLPEDVSAVYTLAWKSSDEAVATVDESGRVSAKAPGRATITAYITQNEDVYASCLVSVSAEGGGGAGSGDVGTAAGTGGGEAGGYAYNQAMQRELLALVNSARAAAGVPAVAWSDSLEASCVVRAEELTQVFSHTRPDGSGCFTVNPLAYGENIAAGYATAGEVFDGWMNSEGHRDNILNGRWTIMGVGYVYAAGGYGHYWCQLFG